MRKTTLIAAMFVGAAGLLAPTAGAFAMGCLNHDLPPIDLSHNAMNPGAGWGYDKGAYDAEYLKGNKCPSTQQSVSVNDNNTLTSKSRSSNGATVQQ